MIVDTKTGRGEWVMKKCALRCWIYRIYPKDSISTTVERSDGFDNALEARYPTSKHYRTKFRGLELISVCFKGQRCIQRAEKAKPYQLECTQSELQGSCTLYCDCRLDLGWLERSIPQKCAQMCSPNLLSPREEGGDDGRKQEAVRASKLRPSPGPCSHM